MAENVMSTVEPDFLTKLQAMLSRGRVRMSITLEPEPERDAGTERQTAGGVVVSSRPAPHAPARRELPEPPEGSEPAQRELWILWTVLIDRRVTHAQVTEFFCQSDETSRGDIGRLVKGGFLRKVGEKRWAHYLPTGSALGEYFQRCRALGLG